ncbi:MAG: ankyrin repeat domain-containing protein [Pyrinomonadaceae bacterium]
MSKKSFINSIDVKSPCSEDWNEMKGNDEVRFCSHCSKHVNNLSEMTRKQAVRLVRESNGNLCVRYIAHPVTRKPMFAEQLLQITRRAPSVAAGVMSASIALSAQAYAQGSPNPTLEPGQRVEVSLDKDAKPNTDANGGITGTIKDPNGAVIVGAEVTIVSVDAGISAASKTDENGTYRFSSLKPGTYRIEAESAGFTRSSKQIVVTDGNVAADIELGITMATMVEIRGDDILNTISGGIGVSSTYYEFSGPLAIAVLNEDLDEARELIIRGVNVNGVEKKSGGVTPIFIAVESGNVEMVEMLLQFRAKINVRDATKQTPIMRLDDDATPELVDLLVRYGAKVNAVDKQGNTALILAAGAADSKVIKALLDAGADVHAVNKEGKTALMEAVSTDDIESVRLLLERGAKVNLKNKNGATALDLAADEEIEKLLETYGAISGREEEETPAPETKNPEILQITSLNYHQF